MVSTYSECQLSNALSCHQVDVEWFQLDSFSELLNIQIVWYMLTIFVGGGFLKRLSINAKFVDSGGQEKVTFSQVATFSVSFL